MRTADVRAIAEMYTAGTRVVQGSVWAWQGTTIHKLTVEGGQVHIDTTALRRPVVIDSLTELHRFFENLKDL